MKALAFSLLLLSSVAFASELPPQAPPVGAVAQLPPQMPDCGCSFGDVCQCGSGCKCEATTYMGAYNEAVRKNAKLVIFVGCEPYKIAGAVTFRRDDLPGYVGPCIVTSAVRDGYLYCEQVSYLKGVQSFQAQTFQSVFQPVVQSARSVQNCST